MRSISRFLGLCVLVVHLTGCRGAPAPQITTGEEKIPILFASYAEYPNQVPRCLVFCESIRAFAGSMSEAPIRVYFSDGLAKLRDEVRGKFESLSVELRELSIPDEARRFVLAGKPLAAARAEADAASEADILAFLDANIIMLQEPRDFLLPKGKDFAYRPVFHRNIGSLYEEPPDVFWGLIYSKLNVPETALFPMKGIADGATLRPYYNAGYLIVRPEKGLLRKWAENFKSCTKDQEVVDLIRDEKHNIFLHQAVLSGTVPVHLERKKTVELPIAYNYPLFFEKFYDSELAFDSLVDVVSIKYEFDFDELADDWTDHIKGPKAALDWIEAHCRETTE